MTNYFDYPLESDSVTPQHAKKEFEYWKDIFEDETVKQKLKDIKINVANAALRTVDFKGGLDKFLLSAKNAKLSKKVKKIKASISAKS